MIVFAKRGGSGRRRHTQRGLHRPAAAAKPRSKHWRPFLIRFFDAFRLAY